MSDDRRQLPLFIDPRGRARLTDPDTSHAAARAHQVRRGSQRWALLAQYEQATDGLTDEQAGQRARISRVADTRRCSELRSAGFIEDTGQRRPTSTGCAAMVCAITEAGRQAMRGAA